MVAITNFLADASTEAFVMVDVVIPEDYEEQGVMGADSEQSRTGDLSAPPSPVSLPVTTSGINSPSTWANTSIPDVESQFDTLDLHSSRPGFSSSSLSVQVIKQGDSADMRGPGSMGIEPEPEDKALLDIHLAWVDEQIRETEARNSKQK